MEGIVPGVVDSAQPSQEESNSHLMSCNPINPAARDAPLTPMVVIPRIEDSAQQGQEQSNSFVEFFTRLYNNEHDPEYEPESTQRISNWISTHPTKSGNEGQSNFKVPDRPQRRAVRAPSSSSTTTGVVPISPQEYALRAYCIGWNYTALRAALQNTLTIQNFCLSCSRCQAMFQTDRLASNIKPFATNENPGTDHIEILKKMMTDKGKTILKAAMIINENLELTISSKVRSTLAKAIGILSYSNCGQLLPESQVTQGNEPRPRSPSSCSDISAMTTSEQQSDKYRIVDPNIPIGTVLRESRKFWVTLEEFTKSPIIFVIEKQQQHRDLSLCGIKPPRGFAPPCLKGDVGIEFQVSNHYINRMMTRWGTAVKAWATLQALQEPTNTLSSLSSVDRQKAITQMTKYWMMREVKILCRSKNPLRHQELMRAGKPLDGDEAHSRLEKICAEIEACVEPGRNMNYNTFQTLARDLKTKYIPDTPHPNVADVERVYWDLVVGTITHVCVHAASVDATELKWGFPDNYEESNVHHFWNLKRLGSSSENLLSFLGPTVGMSLPAVHLGMMFSTSCWHVDPTGLPRIEYLHSNSSPKIWYSISEAQGEVFRAAVQSLCPFAVQNKPIWLPSATIMIPPTMLQPFGVTVERYIQQPGEYVVIYPNTYCASIDTGLTISEVLNYAPHEWLAGIDNTFKYLSASMEPSQFSKEKLMMGIVSSTSATYSLLKQVEPALTALIKRELDLREKLLRRGIDILTPEMFLDQNTMECESSWQLNTSGECAYCRCQLYFSRVVGLTRGETGVCLEHGIFLARYSARRREILVDCCCIALVSSTDLSQTLEDLDRRLLLLQLED